jgi:hypothetical protein
MGKTSFSSRAPQAGKLRFAGFLTLLIWVFWHFSPDLAFTQYIRPIARMMMSNSSTVNATYIVRYLVLGVITAFASAVAFVVAYEWHNLFRSSGLTFEGLIFVGIFVVMIVTLVGRSLDMNLVEIRSSFAKITWLGPRQPLLLYVARVVRFTSDILLVVEKHLVELSGETYETVGRGKIKRGDKKRLEKSIDERIAGLNKRGDAVSRGSNMAKRRRKPEDS